MTESESHRETIAVVGAGVSGLTCAKELAAAGRQVVVIERARGVGGRCATRRVEGQPVDFGATFLHGRDPDFLRVLHEVPATTVLEWPQSIVGTGAPCQPEAFAATDRRLAFAEGVGAFPRALARGLDVRLAVRIARIALGNGVIALQTDDGDTIETGTAVVALAAEQAQALLATVQPPVMGLRAASAILGMTRSHPCLALIATYPPRVTPPAWHASYPEDSAVLQMASHESSKRPKESLLAMVYQAQPRWSRDHLTNDNWPALLLGEAARLFGAWAGAPRSLHQHRWTYARQDLSSELSGPMLIDLPGGARLGLCGDRFAPGGGVQAAWCSGRTLARRLAAKSQRG